MKTQQLLIFNGFTVLKTYTGSFYSVSRQQIPSVVTHWTFKASKTLHSHPKTVLTPHAFRSSLFFRELLMKIPDYALLLCCWCTHMWDRQPPPIYHLSRCAIFGFYNLAVPQQAYTTNSAGHLMKSIRLEFTFFLRGFSLLVWLRPLLTKYSSVMKAAPPPILSPSLISSVRREHRCKAALCCATAGTAARECRASGRGRGARKADDEKRKQEWRRGDMKDSWWTAQSWTAAKSF